MRNAYEWHVHQVSQGVLGTSEVQSVGLELAAQHGRDFEIDQLGGHQAFAPEAAAGGVAVDEIIGQRGDKHAGVKNEHDPR